MNKSHTNRTEQQRTAEEEIDDNTLLGEPCLQYGHLLKLKLLHDLNVDIII